MSTKRHKSTISIDGTNFTIIAIHTDFSPYSLAWCLFDTFSLQFVCENPPFQINLPNQLDSIHAEYHFFGSEDYPRMWLIQNQGTQSRLVNSKPLPDYFLIFEEEDVILHFDHWLETLNRVARIQLAYVFPKDKTKKFHWVNELHHLRFQKQDDVQREFQQDQDRSDDWTGN